jgi:hypothetical protein
VIRMANSGDTLHHIAWEYVGRQSWRSTVNSIYALEKSRQPSNVHFHFFHSAEKQSAEKDNIPLRDSDLI